MNTDHEPSDKKLLVGTGASLGLVSLAGACAGACSTTLALPLAAMLTSIGLGGLSIYLPHLRFPLMIAAALAAIWVLRKVMRGANTTRALTYGLILGGGLVFGAIQVMSQSSCDTTKTTKGIISRLSSDSRSVFVNGVYRLWPQLGRAPTVAEIQRELGLASEAPVLAAFDEMRALGAEDLTYPGTQNLHWIWPFSSEDLGVSVSLAGGKSVFARCAIDALGMSSMFGKPALISIRTPLQRKQVQLRIDGERVVDADPNIVVSSGPSCDEMLFFSSREEFDQYKHKYPGRSLKAYTLDEGLKFGILSFGGIANS